MIPIGKYLYNVVVQRCATRLEKLPHFETDSIFSMRLTDHDLQYCFYKKIPGTWYWKTSATDVLEVDHIQILACRLWYIVQDLYTVKIQPRNAVLRRQRRFHSKARSQQHELVRSYIDYMRNEYIYPDRSIAPGRSWIENGWSERWAKSSLVTVKLVFFHSIS